MSGLNLIQSYLSESEDSADEDKPETKDASISKTLGNRLPIPESILLLEGAKHHEIVFDDPNLHDGRKRSFKHERGNWATLVYVEYIANDGIHSWLREVYKNFFSQDCSLKLFDSVRLLCQRTDTILVELSDLKVYCNEERSRTFLGIRCEDRSKSLRNFVDNLDKILAEYQLPPFYKEASFHISVMWCLGDAEKTLNSKIHLLNESLSKIFAEDIRLSFIEISNIICKIGNRMYTFSLK